MGSVCIPSFTGKRGASEVLGLCGPPTGQGIVPYGSYNYTRDVQLWNLHWRCAVHGCLPSYPIMIIVDISPAPHAVFIDRLTQLVCIVVIIV